MVTENTEPAGWQESPSALSPAEWEHVYAEQEQALGAKIRELRIERGMSQSDLADAMGKRGFPMHQTTVAKLETGKRPLRLTEAMAAASTFGLPAAALLLATFRAETPSEADLRTAISESQSKVHDLRRQLGRAIQQFAHDYAHETRRIIALNEQLDNQLPALDDVQL